jgi:hypothetical protein
VRSWSRYFAAMERGPKSRSKDTLPRSWRAVGSSRRGVHYPESQRLPAKINIGWPCKQSCNATGGGFIAGGALTEPGTRVESHPICLWAEGSDSIRRPIGVVQGSSHNTILSLCGRLGLGNCLQQRSRHYTGLMLFSEGGILRE